MQDELSSDVEDHCHCGAKSASMTHSVLKKTAEILKLDYCVQCLFLRCDLRSDGCGRL